MVASQNLKSFGSCDIFHFILFYFYYYFLSREIKNKFGTAAQTLSCCKAVQLARSCYKKKKLYLVLAC